MGWRIRAIALLLVLLGALVAYKYIASPSNTATRASPPPALAETPRPERRENNTLPRTDAHQVAVADLVRDPSLETAPQYPTSRNFLLIALIVMSLATILSVAISFYLYRWRRLFLGNSHMVVVPEAFDSWINGLKDEVHRNSKSAKMGLATFDRRWASMEEKVANLIETFMTLHKALDEKDAEIKRLKRGYDAEIYSKFVRRFIRVDQAIEDLLLVGQCTQAELEQVRKLLEDAFDACGLEKFAPKVGEDYRQAEGVADDPRIIPPQKPEDALTIAEVVEVGYRRRNREGYEVILPAKVKIFGASA